MESRTEEDRERNKNHNEDIMEKFDRILGMEWCKQNLLHICIDRLENEICLLRGGGRIVQGVWLSGEEFTIAHQGVTDGEYNWDEYLANKLAAEQGSGSTSNGSEQGDVKGMGKWKGKGEEKPRWNPNAVSSP